MYSICTHTCTHIETNIGYFAFWIVSRSHGPQLNSWDRSTILRMHTWVLKSVPKIDPKLVLGNDIENAPRIVLPNHLENIPPYIIKTRVVHYTCMISDTCSQLQQLSATATDSNSSEQQLQIPTAVSYSYRF